MNIHSIIRRLFHERHLVRRWHHLRIDILILDGTPHEIILKNETMDDIEVIQWHVLDPVSKWQFHMHKGMDHDGYTPKNTILMFGTELKADVLMDMCLKALDAAVNEHTNH